MTLCVHSWFPEIGFSMMFGIIYYLLCDVMWPLHRQLMATITTMIESSEKKERIVKLNMTQTRPVQKHRQCFFLLQFGCLRCLLLHHLRWLYGCRLLQPQARCRLKADSSSRWVTSVGMRVRPTEGEEGKANTSLPQEEKLHIVALTLSWLVGLSWIPAEITDQFCFPATDAHQ